MTKINDVDSALAVFEDAAAKHAEATEQGDYKKGNKHYKNIAEAIGFLKNNDLLTRLESYLRHTSVGVRIWSATYLLPIREAEGIKTLEEISSSPGIHAMSAKTTLSEWKKGNLKL